MALKKLAAPGGGRPFAPWRIVVWLVMLLAAVGFVLNAFNAFLSGRAMAELSAEAVANGPDPRVQLAWSLAQALVAFVVMAFALGTLRWRDWGRNGLRIVAVVLMVWAAYTAWVGYEQWQQVGIVLAQAGLPADRVMLGEKLRSILLVGVCLKLVSIPVLGWLAWVLGSLKVRRQFGQFAL